MNDRDQKPSMPGTPRRIVIPDRKISETILDFGAPFLARFDEETPISVFRKALMIVITIWNAHVMAMPIWGEPEHLENLAEVLGRNPEPPGALPVLDTLARRRREKFGDDPRAVGLWDIVADGSGGYKLRCDARIPHCVEPMRRDGAGES